MVVENRRNEKGTRGTQREGWSSVKRGERQRKMRRWRWRRIILIPS